MTKGCPQINIFPKKILVFRNKAFLPEPLHHNLLHSSFKFFLRF